MANRNTSCSSVCPSTVIFTGALKSRSRLGTGSDATPGGAFERGFAFWLWGGVLGFGVRGAVPGPRRARAPGKQAGFAGLRGRRGGRANAACGCFCCRRCYIEARRVARRAPHL